MGCPFGIRKGPIGFFEAGNVRTAGQNSVPSQFVEVPTRLLPHAVPEISKDSSRAASVMGLAAAVQRSFLRENVRYWHESRYESISRLLRSVNWRARRQAASGRLPMPLRAFRSGTSLPMRSSSF
jgi:hypothetical protein